MKTNPRQKLILLDGNSITYRMFFGTINTNVPILRTSSKIPTNSVNSFVNFIFNQVILTYPEAMVLVAFDGHKKTFRHKLYPEYKNNRSKTPIELIQQIPIIKEFLTASDIKYEISDGYEADDIIATYANQGLKKGYDILIISSDKDLLQLVKPNISVLLPKGAQKYDLITSDNFQEKQGLLPNQIITYKSLHGDPSDNIPGIKGIGAIGAKKLLCEYSDINEIFDNYQFLTKRVQNALKDQKEKIEEFKTLVTLKSDLQLKLPQFSPVKNIKYNKIFDFFSKYEMAKATKNYIPEEIIPQNDYQSLEFKKAIKINNPEKLLFKAKLVIFQLPIDNSVPIEEYIYFYHSQSEEIYYIKREEIKQESGFLNFWSNPNIEKIFFDLKGLFDAIYQNEVVDVFNYQDVHIAYFLIDNTNKLSLPNLHRIYNLKLCDNEFYYNTFEQPNEKKLEVKANLKLALMAKTINLLYQKQKNLFLANKDCDLTKAYNEMDIKLPPLLRELQKNGILIDIANLKKDYTNYQNKIEKLSQEIYDLAGYKLNLNSPLQLKQLLFHKLSLDTTFNKAQSTNSKYLLPLAESHPIINLILKYRSYAKLTQTYIKSWIDLVDDNNIIHPQFHQTTVDTFRLSCTHPNLQNIVVHNEEQSFIRKRIISRDKYKFISFDYNQIELRMLAHFTKFNLLIENFNKDWDYHTIAASKLFNIPRAYVKQEQRQIAKTLNYAIIYGSEAWNISQILNIPYEKAKEIYNLFTDLFNPIMEFKKTVIEKVKTNKYIQTLCNHIRYLYDIDTFNKNILKRAERVIFNFLIQGSAADIIKLAMIKTNSYINSNQLPAKFIAQIHDELIFELHNNANQEKFIKDILEIMENIYDLNVKLVVNYKVATDWYNLKK